MSLFYLIFSGVLPVFDAREPRLRIFVRFGKVRRIKRVQGRYEVLRLRRRLSHSSLFPFCRMRRPLLLLLYIG